MNNDQLAYFKGPSMFRVQSILGPFALKVHISLKKASNKLLTFIVCSTLLLTLKAGFVQS